MQIRKMNTLLHHLLLQMRFLVLYSPCISLLFASIDAREFSGSILFDRTQNSIEKTEISPSPEISSGSGNYNSYYKPPQKRWEFWTMLLLLFTLMFFIVVIFKRIKSQGRDKDKKALRSLAQPSVIHSLDKIDETKSTINKAALDTRSELVFFGDERERFELNELMESAADLRTQGFCSSLYVVQIKNGGDGVFAVKRLKKLNVSFEDFGRRMRWVGNMKHPNLLPLVCFNSTGEEKLLVYPYQKNGSLLNLFENYVEGKRTFPWKLRISIALGIARGLDFIHTFRDENDETVPHGNIKLSNIMLSDEQGREEEEIPLISEYGYSQFIDRDSAHCLFGWNGHYHVAPERSLSWHGDVYGFGLILLQMLTGKIAGKNGFDVVRLVRSMVREEWTGEVFDKKMGSVGMCGFALLNVGLKCVSDKIEDRPSMLEVVERIEEVVRAREDASV